ncbi:MAG: isoprenylcysteine carboxylmethyltransferase family protein [Chloroflexi bacterium]|nr:isoprenylcysteine carboxylmethyltransferase family protein [Chloroflexota bacterium]
MSIFVKWAQTEHSLGRRVMATLPAGVLFVGLFPYLILVAFPAMDQRLGVRLLETGAASYLLGGALVAVGLPFALWSIEAQFTRGRGTPLPVMPTQGLLTTGPFCCCRNPMTFGTITAYLGLATAAATTVGLVVVIGLGALLLLYLKRVEEKELAERFGEPYLAYKRSVPFIIPRRPKQGAP